MPSFPWLRLVAFTGIVLHMQAGPIMRQVLRMELPPFGMNWQMYSGRGSDICEVEWYTISGETMEGVDRAALLGDAKGVLPYNLKILRSPDQIQRSADQICRKMRGADVRARARCAIKRGMRWKDVLDVDTPLCGRKLPPPSSKRKSP